MLGHLKTDDMLPKCTHKYISFLLFPDTFQYGSKCQFCMANVRKMWTSIWIQGRTSKRGEDNIYIFDRRVTLPINGIVLPHLFLAQGPTIALFTSLFPTVLRDTQRTQSSSLDTRCWRSWAWAWRPLSLALPFPILRCRHSKKEVRASFNSAQGYTRVYTKAKANIRGCQF